MPNLFAGQVCFGEGSTPLSTTDVLRKRVCRGGVFVGIGPEALLGPHPVSLQHWVTHSMLGNADSAEGQNTAVRRCGNGENLSCGRNIGQLETKLGKDQGNHVDTVPILFVTCLPTNGRFGSYCDQRFALA
jgi:hypothetical protein